MENRRKNLGTSTFFSGRPGKPDRRGKVRRGDSNPYWFGDQSIDGDSLRDIGRLCHFCRQI
jgi:hypothetical protein